MQNRQKIVGTCLSVVIIMSSNVGNQIESKSWFIQCNIFQVDQDSSYFFSLGWFKNSWQLKSSGYTSSLVAWLQSDLANSESERLANVQASALLHLVATQNHLWTCNPCISSSTHCAQIGAWLSNLIHLCSQRIWTKKTSSRIWSTLP